MSDKNKPSVPSCPSCPSCPVYPCGCVGYAYVPVQELEKTYDPMTGLKQGTIFPELDLPMCEYGKVCKAGGSLSNE